MEEKSWYNSENTWLLEKKPCPDGIERTLMLHRLDHPGGGFQYIVGRNFHETRRDGALGYERYDYSWDSGHYFEDFLTAARYWASQVENPERRTSCPECGCPNLTGGPVVIEELAASQEITCDSCGHGWTDHFRYDRLENEEGGRHA